MDMSLGTFMACRCQHLMMVTAGRRIASVSGLQTIYPSACFAFLPLASVDEELPSLTLVCSSESAVDVSSSMLATDR